MTVYQKSFVPPPTSNGPLSNTGNQPAAKAAPTATSMEEASRQAKEAVAAAMAKLNPGTATKPAGPSSNAMDALTKKVGEMRTHDGHPSRGRGSFRGRGAFRSGSGGQPTKKLEIPKDDYDFESANAKFNKDDLVKEAIASGSPLAETAAGEDATGTTEVAPMNGEKRKDSIPATQAYNKTSSFFDNISSEIKDRQEAQEERINGRQLRSEEFKKNMDTFGQGNVDNGGYRGRGRGRGCYRGYSRGFNRGYGGGYQRGGGNVPTTS
jgi:protein LSM14